MALADELLQESTSFVDSLLSDPALTRPHVLFVECHGTSSQAASTLRQRLESRRLPCHTLDLVPIDRPLGNLRFESAVDAIWGPGTFSAKSLSQKIPLLNAEMLEGRGRAWDDKAGELWRHINMNSLITEAIGLTDRLAQQLTTTPSHEKIHLIISNPDLQDYQIFNVLMAMVTEIGRTTSDVAAIWILLDRSNDKLTSAQDLFHSFAGTSASEVKRITWPIPAPRDMERVLERLCPDLPDFRSADVAQPKDEKALPDFITRLNRCLRACSFLELQALLSSDRERFASSGAIQYLYLASLSQGLVQSKIRWLFEDDEVRKSLLESHINTATALYPAISLSLDAIKSDILDRRFPEFLKAMPEAAIQSIQSWALIAYKIENQELADRIPKFLTVWESLGARLFGADERHSFRLVLELMLASALPEEKYPPGWIERLLEEVRLWASHIERISVACPMFLISIDVDASTLKEKTSQQIDISAFGRAALKNRRKAYMFSRLGASLTNVAEECANQGQYEAALQHLEFARCIARYNENSSHGKEDSYRFNAAIAMAALVCSETNGGIIPSDCVARIYDHLQLSSTLASATWRYGQLSDASLALFHACSWRAFEQHFGTLSQLIPEPADAESLQRDRILLCRTLAHAESVASQMPSSATASEILEAAFQSGSGRFLDDLTRRKKESANIFVALGTVIEALRLRRGEVEALTTATHMHLGSTQNNLLLSAMLLRAMHFAQQNPDVDTAILNPLILELRLLAIKAWGEGWTSPERRRQFLSSALLWDFARDQGPLPSDLLAQHLGDAISQLTRIHDSRELAAYVCLIFLICLPVSQIYFASREGDSWNVTSCAHLAPTERAFWRNRTPAFSWKSRMASAAEVETRVPARNGWSTGGSSIFYSRNGTAMELTLLDGYSTQEIGTHLNQNLVPNVFLEAVAVAKGTCDLARKWAQREHEGREYTKSLGVNTLQPSTFFG